MSSSMTTMNAEESYWNSFPPGYRFDPTEEELIVEYLKKKLENSPLPKNRINDANIYNHNPWDLTENSTSYGGNEYYFFTPRERKYPNGSLPKRTAGVGYWKATGNKERPIYDSNGVEIGSTKMLVFYKGKAHTGEKTPWVMQEYKAKAAQGNSTSDHTTAARSATGGNMQLDEWVLCKIYKKKEEEPAATPPQQAAAPAASATLIESREERNDDDGMFNIEEYLDTPAPAAPAVLASAENHLNIMEAENTATREENMTERYIFPGSDIDFDQGIEMLLFGR